MTHRLFLAIDLPQNLQREITAWLTRLPQPVLPVAWEEPEKLHLTLNFLGRVPETKVRLVIKLLRATSQNWPHFTLVPLWLQTLYHRHQPSLVYLSVGGDLDLFTPLQKSLSDALDSLFLWQPRRKFLPHINLGRLKRADQISTKRALEAISDLPPPQFSPFLVDHLVLYESFLSRHGSHYQKVASFMLKSPSPV